MKSKVLLISFYSEKGLAVKYLSHELNKHGYKSYILYFKGYDEFAPKSPTEDELRLLEDMIIKIAPQYIGLSVLSSLYMETVQLVNNRIKSKFDVPVIWGGYYPTLLPEVAAEHADYVIRGEGLKSLLELIDTLENEKDPSEVKNLVMKCKGGEVIKNPLRPLVQNLDDIGYFRLGESPVFFINNGILFKEDPQLEQHTYDLIASTGCPFSCSYCSNGKIKLLYKGKGNFVRCRSVDNIIEELKEAKQAVKHLKFICFWDEIFPDNPDWIEEFKEKYKKNINLPFWIMLHPLKVKQHNIENLVEAGLWRALVGIQSGSTRVRRDIFNRYEKNEDIIQASKILSEAKVPWVTYDFMIQHVFETVDDLKETFDMLLDMYPPFELRVHSLFFLPGTDIVDKAIEMEIISWGELDKIMNAPMQEQYEAVSMGVKDNHKKSMVMWASLIYLTQFSVLRPYLRFLAKKGEKGKMEKEIYFLRIIMERIHRLKNLASKFQMFMGVPGDSYFANFLGVLKHVFHKKWGKNFTA